MVAGGLTEKIAVDNTKQFYFFEPDHIPPPVIMVIIFMNLEKKPIFFNFFDSVVIKRLFIIYKKRV